MLMSSSQIFSGHVPFFEVQNNAHVIFQLCSNTATLTRPPPIVSLARGLDEGMWSFIKHCTTPIPAGRPSASYAVNYLSSRSDTGIDQRPPDWAWATTVTQPVSNLGEHCDSLAKAFANFTGTSKPRARFADCECGTAREHWYEILWTWAQFPILFM